MLIVKPLQTLKNLNWNTVAQGDMLYTKDMLQNANIEGENYLIFKPNTIVYAIPSDSDLAKEIENIGNIFGHGRCCNEREMQMSGLFLLL